MIELFGPRPTVSSGTAAAHQNGQVDVKVVHRPSTVVLPAERVDKAAQTGPRPAFQHTYLERAAAYWPEEPERPVTSVDYQVPGPPDTEADEPTVDIRR